MVDHTFQLMPMGTEAAREAVEAIERDYGLHFDPETRAAYIRQGLLTEPQRKAIEAFGADYPDEARLTAGAPREARIGVLRYYYDRLRADDAPPEQVARGRTALEAIARTFGFMLVGASVTVTASGKVVDVTVGRP
jgi:hypothetical protein